VDWTALLDYWTHQTASEGKNENTYIQNSQMTTLQNLCKARKPGGCYKIALSLKISSPVLCVFRNEPFERQTANLNWPGTI